MNKYDEWIEDNPLRQFRRKHDNIPRTKLAGYLGVAMNTVQFWENGTSVPNDENFEKISVVMKINSNKLKAMWDNWLNSKPKFDLSNN